MTDDSQTPTGDPIEEESSRSRAVAIGIGAVAVIALIALLVFLAVRSDDTEVAVDETTTTTTIVDDTTTTVDEAAAAATRAAATPSRADPTPVEATTTTVEATTTTIDDGSGPTPEELAFTVWPPAASDLRYADPLDAAEGFAVDFLGMTDPLIGEFMRGDLRSGEVEIRGIDGSTPTLVALRTYGTDGNWWVVAANSPDIVVDEPTFDTEITSPLRLAGRSATFEGTVEVEIRADGEDDPLFEGFVTGGAAPGEPAPFAETIEWDPPESGRGVIVFFERSSDDGRVLQATIVRVTFAES
ncbi:MAG: hypothetical protein EA389_09805 [Ilumatobacter sp.]|nr:MAG: hypothetical protein EA389_09805 [Ilumatobacter sp.]